MDGSWIVWRESLADILCPLQLHQLLTGSAVADGEYVLHV